MLKTNSWMDLEMSDLGILEFGGLFTENEEILNLPQVEDIGLAQPKEETDFVKKEDLLGEIVSNMELDKIEDSITFLNEPSTSGQFVVPMNDVLPASSPALSPCPSSSSSNDDTQSLIEEMEEFLTQQEQDPSSPQKAEEEAEKLLDALLKGEVTMDDDQVNNVTQMQTLDDGNIVIVIANDDEDKQSLAASPISEATVDSDSDWTPESPVEQKRARGRPIKPQEGRVVKKRGPYNTKNRRGQVEVRDKKERKKLQNVVAARRYRDKKKSEMNQVEQVEADLAQKNSELKEQLAEMEGEVKTLKKLLVELGLVTIN